MIRLLTWGVFATAVGWEVYSTWPAAVIVQLGELLRTVYLSM